MRISSRTFHLLVGRRTSVGVEGSSTRQSV